jgi:endothelin-converting enzyme/putative endopeptidase
VGPAHYSAGNAPLGRRESSLPRVGKSLEGKPRPADIDGFSAEQQFFVAWGQWRGDAIRIEEQRVMMQTDLHPIGKYRVDGPLSNLPEFQTAFHCKTDSNMLRPADKRCDVW